MRTYSFVRWAAHIGPQPTGPQPSAYVRTYFQVFSLGVFVALWVGPLPASAHRLSADRPTAERDSAMVEKAVAIYMSLSSAAAPTGNWTTTTTTPAYKREAKSIEESLDIGGKAWHFLVNKVGEEKANRYFGWVTNQSESGQERLPFGFWKDFCETIMEVEYTNKRRQRYSVSLVTYLQALSSGGTSRESLRGRRKRGSKRLASGDRARKAPGISIALLQFFVDEIQVMKNRADSSLLLAKAHHLKRILIHKGFREETLPKINPQWLWRWRKGWGIIMKATGMKLKVAWRKVLRRVRVLLMNIFRLSVCKYVRKHVYV